MSNRKINLLLGNLLFVLSCGQVHQFISGGSIKAKDSKSVPQGENSTSEVPPTTPSEEQVPNDTANPVPIPTGNDDCPSVMQDVLILDFKSGWWAGDSGNFFQTLLKDISEPCAQVFTFEFHHILDGTNTYQVFPNGKLTSGSIQEISKATLKEDWNGYSQIWVLSGSQFDRLDMKVEFPLFVEILNKIANVKVPLFLGSGNGNMSHVNSILAQLGYKTRFATDVKEGTVVLSTYDIAVADRLKMGKDLSSHFLFSRGIQEIADTIQILKPLQTNQTLSMISDYLTMNDDFTVIGRNLKGQSSIAISELESRRIVLDAGLARFYAIKMPGEQQTLTYLQNIALYLSGK